MIWRSKMMRKKSSSFDLTPLLDVILILLFLALIINAGEIIDVRAHLEESEEQRALLESERDNAILSLNDANDRLEALSDWDNERTSLLDEIGALSSWKTAAEGVMHFITINYQADDDPRKVIVSAEPDIEGMFEFIWEGNNIVNKDQFSDDINSLLLDIVQSKSTGQPILILFEHRGIRTQEFNLVNDEIVSLAESENAKNDFNIYYSKYEEN